MGESAAKVLEPEPNRDPTPTRRPDRPNQADRLLAYEKSVRRRLEKIHQLAIKPSARQIELEICRRDPLHWLDWWGWTYDPRYAPDPTHLPFDTWPRQRELIGFLQARHAAREDGVVKKSPDQGGTSLLCAYALHQWLFTPGYKAIFTGPRLDVIDKAGSQDTAFEKLRIMLRALPAWMLPEGFDKPTHDLLLRLINPANGNTIGGAQLGRGGRSSMLFVDDAAGIEQDLDVATSDVRIFQSGIHSATDAFARKCRSETLRPEQIFELHYRDDEHRPPEYYERRRRQTETTRWAVEYEIDLAAAIAVESEPTDAAPELAPEVRDSIATDQEKSADLVGFVQAAWHVLEPEQEYRHGWHIDAIAAHLTAVHDGQINRLLANVPPGTMKSLLVGVFFPAWEWGPKNKPAMRYLGTSHAQPLAIRDNLKMRRLVESKWYQQRWPQVVLTGDQNAKGKFENTSTGFREAMAFTGLTGSRGDRVLIDDPLSVDNAMSEAEREAVNTTFRESVPTRLNNPKSSAIIVVMQRLHENDVAGLILEKEFGYEHLMLPMEFEPERKCRTSIGFEDPRTKRDELLFPERFPREVVERDKKVLGPYGTAGQLQQRPAPLGGGMFKKGKALIVDALPKHLWRTVRGWDLASTEGQDAAYTAGVKMVEDRDGMVYVTDVLRDHLSPLGVDRALRSCASTDGRSCVIDIPTDPGQAGKDSTGHRTRLLSGYTVRTSPESGSKVERAMPFASQWEAGNVRLLRAPWNDEYLNELQSFPRGKFADQVDASSRAYNQLASGPRPIIISDEAIAQSRRPGR